MYYDFAIYLCSFALVRLQSTFRGSGLRSAALVFGSCKEQKMLFALSREQVLSCTLHRKNLD
ncbi:hypothetical protein Plhal304r1_c002g0005941 [Plasmopara halstedii]